tara:strand:- start:41 stop:265 length:225 start_codon:yes stop_codon:yes gene_type:complete
MHWIGAFGVCDLFVIGAFVARVDRGCLIHDQYLSFCARMAAVAACSHPWGVVYFGHFVVFQSDPVLASLASIPH